MQKVRRTSRAQKWVCGQLYKGMCGTLELHLVAFGYGYLFEGFQGGVPNRDAAFAAGSLPIIQFALGDGSCRQRTLRQTSHRVWKDGDTGTTLYFLCDKTNSAVFGD